MRSTRAFCVILAVLVIIAITPLTALGLVNEYGMTFSGQAKCLECHDGKYADTVHGRFAKVGLVPGTPSGWTAFKAAGDPPVVGSASPGNGNAWFSSGGTYSLNLPWITLGDYAGGSGTEYIYFNGNTTGNKNNPWNLLEGLGADPSTGAYDVAAEAPTTGLYDVTYSCQRCHMLGTTYATANSTATAAVPNPCVSVAATYTTAQQWARSENTTVGEFNTSATVAQAGMSIQCEACHGTGFKSSSNTTKHWNSGTQLSNRVPTGTVAPSGLLPGTTISTLGDSEVCGQCHGSYTNVAGTLGIYGYTPNLKLRNFVDINGSSGGASYTYTPTEAEFLASPTKYWLFPNGDNAKGSHFYYNEWAASGHAFRGALGPSGPDVLPGGSHGHYNAKTSGLDCATCHTGEGYLKSKDYQNTDPMTDPWKNFTPTTATVGFMGQECVTCHDAHPASAEGAGNIRAGDPAGVRSNYGTSNSNATVCEDCHNWQFETQQSAGNATAIPAYKPQALVSSRGGPSHPQRETLHGRVMLEVPQAAEFMPNVVCQDCHMVKTNKSANRISHGMHIMLPGKAKLWNTAAGAAYVGEDSCSKCHPGETRDELQADIDKWQSDAAAAANDASTAIQAAVNRADAEFSLTDTTKPGYILAGRATWNFKAFGSDGSNGAHNPPYEIAGLQAATKMAKSVGGSFDNLYDTPQVMFGSVALISAHVSNGDDTNASGASVTLESLVNGVWTQQGSAITVPDNGNVAFTLVPGGTSSYRLRWHRCSDSAADLLSSVMNIQVLSTTTLSANRASMSYGSYVALSGSVFPNASGQKCTLQGKLGSGAWRNVYTCTLSSSSTYSRSVKPTARGTWYYRAVYSGGSAITGSTSPAKKVVVR